MGCERDAMIKIPWIRSYYVWNHFNFYSKFRMNFDPHKKLETSNLIWNVLTYEGQVIAFMTCPRSSLFLMWITPRRYISVVLMLWGIILLCASNTNRPYTSMKGVVTCIRKSNIEHVTFKLLAQSSNQLS